MDNIGLILFKVPNLSISLNMLSTSRFFGVRGRHRRHGSPVPNLSASIMPPQLGHAHRYNAGGNPSFATA